MKLVRQGRLNEACKYFHRIFTQSELEDDREIQMMYIRFSLLDGNLDFFNDFSEDKEINIYQLNKLYLRAIQYQYSTENNDEYLYQLISDIETIRRTDERMDNIFKQIFANSDCEIELTPNIDVAIAMYEIDQDEAVQYLSCYLDELIEKRREL